MMKQWMYDEKGLIIGVKQARWEEPMPNGCIMKIFKYFKDDYQYLCKMMMQMSEEMQITMIDKSFSDEFNPELRQFLMNEISINFAKLINFQKIKVRKYLFFLYISVKIHSHCTPIST